MIVDNQAFSVKFVELVICHQEFQVISHVQFHKFKVFVFVVTMLIALIFMSKLFQFNIQLSNENTADVVKLSANESDHEIVLTVNQLLHTFPALVNVLFHRHSNVYTWVFDVRVARFVKLILQNTDVVVDVVQVLLADPEKSTLPILGISWVIVATHAVVNVAVSCGNGTLIDQVADDHVAPLIQFVVTGAVKAAVHSDFIVFQPASHDHQVAELISHEALQVHVISWKSTFEALTAFATIVLGVHVTFDFIKSLCNAEFLPANETVQFTVIFDHNNTTGLLAADQVSVKLLYVLFPEIV